MLLSISLAAQTGDEDEDGEDLPQVMVTAASNLAADGVTAEREKRVIMMMVSQEFCPFCEDIKRDVIRPMLLGGDFKDQLMIRELSIDPGVELTDFAGAKRSGIDLAVEYNADLTPTLLFLSSEGRELSNRIIGYTTPAFFYYYVEESIKSAIQALD